MMRSKRRREVEPRLVGRREAILALGSAGLGAIALAAPPLRRLGLSALDGDEAWAQACTRAPELTEGPYYISNSQLRRNILERRPGVTLWLSLRVIDAGTCSTIPGAVVDIWHADADGEYSGFNGADNDTFMRGRQGVGNSGVASFRTVYPGWYPGRTPHVHIKVHVAGAEVHTGQLFMEESVTDAVYAREPYASRGERDTRNAADQIFRSGGDATILTIAPRGKGLWGSITLAVAT